MAYLSTSRPEEHSAASSSSWLAGRWSVFVNHYNVMLNQPLVSSELRSLCSLIGQAASHQSLDSYNWTCMCRFLVGWLNQYRQYMTQTLCIWNGIFELHVCTTTNSFIQMRHASTNGAMEPQGGKARWMWSEPIGQWRKWYHFDGVFMISVRNKGNRQRQTAVKVKMSGAGQCLLLFVLAGEF